MKASVSNVVPRVRTGLPRERHVAESQVFALGFQVHGRETEDNMVGVTDVTMVMLWRHAVRPGRGQVGVRRSTMMAYYRPVVVGSHMQVHVSGVMELEGQGREKLNKTRDKDRIEILSLMDWNIASHVDGEVPAAMHPKLPTVWALIPPHLIPKDTIVHEEDGSKWVKLEAVPPGVAVLRAAFHRGDLKGDMPCVGHEGVSAGYGTLVGNFAPIVADMLDEFNKQQTPNEDVMLDETGQLRGDFALALRQRLGFSVTAQDVVNAIDNFDNDFKGIVMASAPWVQIVQAASMYSPWPWGGTTFHPIDALDGPDRARFAPVDLAELQLQVRRPRRNLRPQSASRRQSATPAG